MNPVIELGPRRMGFTWAMWNTELAMKPTFGAVAADVRLVKQLAFALNSSDAGLPLAWGPIECKSSLEKDYGRDGDSPNRHALDAGGG